MSYADAQVGKILDRLDELDARDDTIIVVWGDHGWHLGEHGVWGKHTLFEESLRAPLIFCHAGMPQPGRPSHSVVETLDIFPTLCDLADLPMPGFVQGVSLRPMLQDPSSRGHAAISYARARTIRTRTHRLVAHPDGYAELYDHDSAEKETRNVAAEHPDLVERLLGQLDARLPR